MDSEHVVRFMTNFERLKSWLDDADDLIGDAIRDESVRDLCLKTYRDAFMLRYAEGRKPTLFAAPTNPAFIAAWRDYEDRFAQTVEWISATVSLVDLGLIDGDLHAALADGQPHPPTPAERWERADAEAARRMEFIEGVFNFAENEIGTEGLWDDHPDLIEDIETGLSTWRDLSAQTGLDLRGILRRRTLVPFVLVPRKVSEKHGSAEKLSMLRNLRQAHDAFVFGTTYAALALMRSIMEAALRDHYRVEGKDLNERIRNAGKRLPLAANEAALHRLRRLANAILHLDREKDEGLPEMDEVRLEKEIVSLLFVLRALIEGVR